MKPPTKFVREIVEPLAGPARTLALLHFVDAIGSGLFWGGSLVYFIRVSGFDPAFVAFGFACAGLAGFVSSVVLGAAGDQFGPRRTLATILGLLAVCYLAYPLVKNPVVF